MRANLRCNCVRGHHAFRAFPKSAAFGNRFVECARGQRRSQQYADRVCARGLPKHGDVVRVATKRCCIPLHPLQCGNLVQHSIHARGLACRFRIEVGARQKAEYAQSVVHGYDHGALLGEIAAFPARVAGGAKLEAAAVQPYHDGTLFLSGLRACPHIQGQTIFTRLAVVYWAKGRTLPAGVAVLRGIFGTAPVRRRLRRAPTQITHRGGSEGNALEAKDARRIPWIAGQRAILYRDRAAHWDQRCVAAPAACQHAAGHRNDEGGGSAHAPRIF